MGIKTSPGATLFALARFNGYVIISAGHKSAGSVPITLAAVINFTRCSPLKVIYSHPCKQSEYMGA